MVLFPEIQGKAQAEFDAIVGSERSPSFNDHDSLPYINADRKEVLRWHAVEFLSTVSMSSDTFEYAHQYEKDSIAPRRHRRHLFRRVPHHKVIVHHQKRVGSTVSVSLHI